MAVVTQALYAAKVRGILPICIRCEDQPRLPRCAAVIQQSHFGSLTNFRFSLNFLSSLELASGKLKSAGVNLWIRLGSLENLKKAQAP